jgi:hypothetical protein
MPLFLVRWPWLKASLVSARDEDDLLDILDQVEDSEGANWSLYRGPVWVDFDLPARYRIDEKTPGEPLRSDEIVVEDVSSLEIGRFEFSTPDCDHAAEMDEAITRKAFPHVHRALWGSDDDPDEDELRRAVAEDLALFIKADWSRATRRRRGDRLGQLAEMVGAPVRQVQNVLKRAGQLPREKPRKKRAAVKRLTKRRP